METTLKQQIAQGVRDFITTHGISQADVAKKSGVRKEYVNIIIKEESNFMYDAGGKTGLIPAKHFYALAELVGISTKKEYWELQPTDQLNTILSNLQTAKQNGSTNVIIGDTGAGKTYALDLFAKKHPQDVFTLKVGSSDNLGDLIDKIIEQLNISTGKTKSKKIRDIAKKLRELKALGFSPMIVFDESEYMKQPALCACKELYDNIHEHCSLVLIGTDQLIDNIDRLRKRNKAGIPQFYRRIKFGIRQLPPIDRSFSTFLTDINDRKLRTFLQRNCENYGELHDALVPALREADETKQPLTENLVRTVLGIPDTMYV